jgi:anti-sigma regulatory factor (Ser/Thr protein kinase)
LHPTEIPEVWLKVNACEAFLPLATSFVEKAVLAFGLGESEALALTLATEEVFSHLYRVALPHGGTVEIHASRGGYFVRVDFSFPYAELNLRAFNLTTTVCLEDETCLEEINLLLASRAVDRFQISREKGSRLRLTLIKEKRYPSLVPDLKFSVRPLTDFAVRSPNPEELKLFVNLVRKIYPLQVLPDFFGYAGKVVDMYIAGECHAALAVGPGDEIGGGILWLPRGRKTIECFGPYTFAPSQGSTMPQALLESCLVANARSHAVGLLNRLPSPDFPETQFESLGKITLYDKEGGVCRLNAWFRLLQEDLGSSVWVHPQLEDFLRQEYQRLVLPRAIQLEQYQGEKRSPHSVLAAEFNRSQKQVILRPIWSGEDLGDNLARHLRLLEQEGIPNIFFEMDLGQSWQADFTPALLENKFQPRLILPYGGDGDVVVFQWERSTP